ncbi:MAG: DUF3280 domain-containing protein [Aliidongia sp.]
MLRRLPILCALMMTAVTGASGAEAPATVAVFDVQFVNASLEQTTPAETERVRALTQQLRDALAKSGRYKVVDLAPIKDDLAQNADLSRCNGCELPLAKKVGASQAAVAWVHKVSNIVLDLNLEIDDTTTGKRVASGTVELKGNSDETWSRGLSYLLENRIFDKAGGHG